MKSSRNDPVLPCPTCRSLGNWFAAVNGPFCSKRCRLVDLGRWLNEENKISKPLEQSDISAAEVVASAGIPVPDPSE